MTRSRALPFAIFILAACSTIAEAKPLKLHAIFTSHMVLQRDKPIMIWGWADAGDKVSVKFGDQQAEATAKGDAGRWEVTFTARQASTTPLTLVVSTGDEKVAMEDILGESGDTIPFIRSPRRRPFLVGRKSGENLKNLGTPY